jgi:hypothetical protein
LNLVNAFVRRFAATSFWVALILSVRPTGPSASQQEQQPAPKRPARPPDMYFAPTSQEVAEQMLKLARVSAGDVA